VDSLEVRLDRLLNLLNQRPSANELLQNLETDLLSSFKISNAIIFNLDSHNVATELYSNNPYPETADYADFKSVLNLLEPTSNIATLTASTIAKSNNNDFMVIPISNGKILKGYILLKMETASLTPQELHLIEVIGKVCAVYLKVELPELKHPHLTKELSSKVSFSARQLQILQGFVEGKTNHELAEDLGFSVSTIRHETMEIYRTLGASDRKEAAKIAQDKSII
jgi:DNA-binding CsgD family transcriptional regulator